MLTRRRFVGTLSASLLAAPLAAQAQQAKQAIRRIGFLSTRTDTPVVEAFRQGLREHGYIEGQNLLIEWRFGEGRPDRLPGFAAALVRSGVGVIVTFAPEAVLAARNATGAIPIVFTQVVDPVALGIVSSLARPGGNLSGFSMLAVDLTGKRLELLKEAAPSMRAAVLLTDRANPAKAAVLEEAQTAARRLGLGVRLIEVDHADELEPAFTTIAREHRVLGVVLVPSTFFIVHRIQIAELAMKRRLAIVGWVSGLTKSGALISYGPSTVEMVRRAAGHVDKILRGAKPGELPVEQPTKFELIINMRTAKALGLIMPASLLARADHIIE